MPPLSNFAQWAGYLLACVSFALVYVAWLELRALRSMIRASDSRVGRIENALRMV